MLYKNIGLIFVAMIAVSAPAYAIDMRNFNDMAQRMGFLSHYAAGATAARTIKVAVFDNGFDGYNKLLGKSLPTQTRYFAGEDTGTPVSSDHGIAMAELLTAFMTNNMKQPGLAPQLYLFRVDGYTNLKNSIDKAIELKVDVILHSMVREYGSNWDGRGFFNVQVNRALDAGILWFNAAGNFGKTTYNLGGMPTNADGWVELPGENQSVPVRCKPSPGAKTCPARFVLSWNSFSDDVNAGTNKDLDLYLTDDTLNIVQASSLVQTTDPHTTVPGTSLYPREIIEVELSPGRYFLRVKNRSQNFIKSDSLRLTADSDSVTFEYFDSNENILNPADNLRVITVGASDSDRSSQSSKLHKPEIASLSYVQTGADQGYIGSSNSAAIAAAAAGLTLSETANPLGRDQMILNLKNNFFGSKFGNGLSTRVLGFGPANGQCFEKVSLPSLPAYIQNVLQKGGVFVRTTIGFRILVNFDPIKLAPNLHRYNADDIIVATPGGIATVLRSQLADVPNNFAEIFEAPSDVGVCP